MESFTILYFTLTKLSINCSDKVCAERLTSEEVFLSVDEVVRRLVHLNLTLPRLRHVPHPRVAGYHVELREQNTISLMAEHLLCMCISNLICNLSLHL